MGRRVRWYDIETEAEPVSPRALARKMLADRFAKGSSAGFIVEAVRDDWVEARYIERFETVEQVADPFGNEMVYERVIFREVRFRYSLDMPCLECLDAPRSINALVARFNEFFAGRASIEPIDIDLRLWLRALQRTVPRLQVRGLEVSGLELDGETTARCLFRGSRDVRRAAAKLVPRAEGKVDRITVAWRVTALESAVATLTTGAARYDASMDRAIREPLRASLRSAMDDAKRRRVPLSTVRSR